MGVLTTYQSDLDKKLLSSKCTDLLIDARQAVPKCLGSDSTFHFVDITIAALK